jgi:putative redox protein
MGTRTANVTLDGDGYRFIGTTNSGHTIVFDDRTSNTGSRPADLVPLAVAACTAFDVISILRKKRQNVEHYAVDANSVQAVEHPNEFTRVDVVHVVRGAGLDPAAVARAVELSALKYCAVGSTLASGVTEIHHGYRATDTTTGVETAGEVVVLGPNAAPTAPVMAG